MTDQVSTYIDYTIIEFIQAIPDSKLRHRVAKYLMSYPEFLNNLNSIYLYHLQYIIFILSATELVYQGRLYTLCTLSKKQETDKNDYHFTSSNAIKAINDKYLIDNSYLLEFNHNTQTIHFIYYMYLGALCTMKPNPVIKSFSYIVVSDTLLLAVANVIPSDSNQIRNIRIVEFCI